MNLGTNGHVDSAKENLPMLQKHFALLVPGIPNQTTNLSSQNLFITATMGA